MLTIFVFHTEVYYKEHEVTPYYVYTTNAIILFYFISGYLFFNEKKFNLKRKTLSIVRFMLIPYFIFTPIIGLLKNIVYGTYNFKESIIDIITGRASWFIVTLIVAELAFSLLLAASCRKCVWLIIVSSACFIFYYHIPFNLYNYWQWQDVLLAMPFLLAGYLFHQYEKRIICTTKALYLIPLTVLFIIIKAYEIELNPTMRNISIEHIPLFLADSMLFLLIIISIIKYIPMCKSIEWIGSHSIVYYFLCGGCPLIVSKTFNYIGVSYDNYLYRFTLAVICCLLLATLLTWFIYKYVPCVIGKK